MKHTSITVAILLCAGVTGCRKTEAAADAAAAAASSVAADIAAASAQVDTTIDTAALAPPAALVAADPHIPVNEAVVGTNTLPADYFADEAPPAPVVENQPTQPEADDTWVAGYWWWSRPLHRYVWVSGAWRRPPPDQVWVAGSWNAAGSRYAWTPGYWGPRGYAREMIDVAPPPPQYEERGVAPGDGYTWTPGYYVHRGGSYSWSRGAWSRPPSAGVMWVEPRYVSTGGRYYLQPGRWDHPPERRGTVYRPDIDARPGTRIAFVPVPQTVVVEHERFASASAHAVARGATRSATGEFVMPRSNPVVVREHPQDHEQAREQGHEHERDPQQRTEVARPVENDTRGARPVENDTRGARPVTTETRNARPVEDQQRASPRETRTDVHATGGAPEHHEATERGREQHQSPPVPTATTTVRQQERRR